MKRILCFLIVFSCTLFCTTSTAESYIEDIVCSVSNETTVYVSPTGKCYHYSSSCCGKNAKKTTLKKAKDSGYRACKKCVG